MVIVDTTVWIDYLNGAVTPQTEWLDREAERQRLGILDLCLCEVLQGLSNDSEAATVLRHLRRFEIFQTGGIELATEAARNYRQLRQRGRTVGRRSIASSPRSACVKGTPCSIQTTTSIPSRTSWGSRWSTRRAV